MTDEERRAESQKMKEKGHLWADKHELFMFIFTSALFVVALIDVFRILGWLTKIITGIVLF